MQQRESFVCYHSLYEAVRDQVAVMRAILRGKRAQGVGGLAGLDKPEAVRERGSAPFLGGDNAARLQQDRQWMDDFVSELGGETIGKE